MAIEKRPAELLLVFEQNGLTVRGMSLSEHVYADGEYMKTLPPVSVASLDDPQIAAIVERFNVSVLSERDAAWEEVNALKEELATAWIACDSANAQIRELGEKFKDYDLLKTNYDLAADENTRLKKQLESIQANRS